jgi:hypothetical protein
MMGSFREMNDAWLRGFGNKTLHAVGVRQIALRARHCQIYDAHL